MKENPNTARALTAAVLETARWIDASDDNRRETAQVLAGRAWINTKPEILQGRMLGQYENGLGQKWQDPHAMRFFHDGSVSFPYLSDGMWFLTQLKRWGMLTQDPDYLAVAKQINQIDIYKQAASAVGNVTLPGSEMRSSTLMDGKVWDGLNPAAYAASFAINHKEVVMKTQTRSLAQPETLPTHATVVPLQVTPKDAFTCAPASVFAACHSRAVRCAASAPDLADRGAFQQRLSRPVRHLGGGESPVRRSVL